MNNQYHTFSLVQGRLDLEITPNRGVSGFSLGRDISKILQILEQNLVVLTKINFMVNQNSNSSSPIILEIKPYQLYLIFDQNTQLLEQIVLADLTKVNLRIKNYIISSHKVSLTSSLVHKILG
ncbi:hypothetical protein CONCODRAFT_142799 [Conidiobolus coronatus NRRL 28638]|uniref:Uncharacterized protein n=1 Tax=Conidiobolus coronatus (strain ATCC 28846 / CBS 209.66 / NRRL 28638) TaxID=796925 RepID=A0A137NRK7_CONC2|nr:hypothetical protein CONCODRAFT_142799 [Conidiobolus coronatus NRRL 28638]|eukprot:KXN65375.1 hypothetical protein CONCODRAFT_142799 [Conidiobolus coronatus NRRL 28638]